MGPTTEQWAPRRSSGPHDGAVGPHDGAVGPTTEDEDFCRRPRLCFSFFNNTIILMRSSFGLLYTGVTKEIKID